MKTKDFYFNLPEDLIAQQPSRERDQSSLFILNRNDASFQHAAMRDFASFVDAGTLIVRNNTKVRKARMYAQKTTGSSVEFLFLQSISSREWLVVTSKAKKQKIGDQYIFPKDINGTITGEAAEKSEHSFSVKQLQLSEPISEDYFYAYGHVPLPPYIKRADTDDDSLRYQTVYARQTGSVAAPTAGLHFTSAIEEEIRSRGADITDITLHVGLGTFMPIRTELIHEHEMHSEEYHISEESARKIHEAKKSGRKILAVGTTSVRTLESAADEQGIIKPGSGSTDLFITPGYRFRIVDQLFTNFHTPESTLLILVSAFAGKKLIFSAYEEAVRKRYRFFSYGDAMLIR